LGSNHCPDG